MIVLVLAVGWYVALIALGVSVAVTGRSRREAAPHDLAETYELTRWSDRIRHVNRVREEELAQLRRRQTPRLRFGRPAQPV
ncbi:MAG TPA: hypothetical protein VL460_05910 [Caulobacteraceae bacterium]|jgi:hypothetical protein|nr:hypothetical protein [Caulobacteraceae bacterium]